MKNPALCVRRTHLVEALEEAFGKPELCGLRPLGGFDVEGVQICILFQEEEQAEILQRCLNKLIDKVWFGPRALIETNPEFVQFLPYVVLGDDNGLLTYQRPAKGEGEKRLAGATSIGFGGHIEPDDWMMMSDSTDQLQEILINAAIREVREELELGLPPFPAYPSGILLDNSNPVGLVHFGLVYSLSLEGTVLSTEVAPQLGEVMNLKQVDAELLRQDPGALAELIIRCEPWSAMILNTALGASQPQDLESKSDGS